MTDSTQTRLGPPRYYAPVYIRYPQGYYGGPADYREVSASDKTRGPITIEPRRTFLAEVRELRRLVNNEVMAVMLPLLTWTADRLNRAIRRWMR